MLHKFSVFLFLPAPLRRTPQMPFSQPAQPISKKSNMPITKTKAIFFKEIETNIALSGRRKQYCEEADYRL